MKRISKEDRYLIETLLNNDYYYIQIAEHLHRDRSVIYREIKNRYWIRKRSCFNQKSIKCNKLKLFVMVVPD